MKTKENFLKVVFFIILSWFAAILVFCNYWNWFVSPICELRNISLKEAFFLYTFILFIKFKKDKKETDEEIIEASKIYVVLCVILLILGYYSK